MNSVREDGGKRGGPAGEERRLQSRCERLAVAIREMHSDAVRLRVHNPDFLGAVRKIQFHLEIELRRGVGIGRYLDR